MYGQIYAHFSFMIQTLHNTTNKNKSINKYKYVASVITGLVTSKLLLQLVHARSSLVTK